MEEKILSIIVPTYNMQQYLSKCLDSLVVPHSDIIEVLIINDGSKDNSLSIAETYQKKYPLIFKVINKTNGNYGSCINVGLKKATGKYIKVLDADDVFDKIAFEATLEKLIHLDVDLVLTDYVKVYPDKEENIICDLSDNRIFDFSEECKHKKKINNLLMYNVMYKRQNLLNINYQQTEGISYTDQEWIFMPFITVSTAVYLPFALYRYTLGREGQTMNPEFEDIHFLDNAICTKNIIRIWSVWRKQDVPTPIMEFLQFKLYRRLKVVYRKCMLHMKDKLQDTRLIELDKAVKKYNSELYSITGDMLLSKPLFPIHYIKRWRNNPTDKILNITIALYKLLHRK